jgi:hypothetical protein
MQHGWHTWMATLFFKKSVPRWHTKHDTDTRCYPQIIANIYLCQLDDQILVGPATNQPTPWSWALLEKPPVAQLLKNLPTFYGSRRFITVFTRDLHWSLSWARWIQSIPIHPIYYKILVTVSVPCHCTSNQKKKSQHYVYTIDHEAPDGKGKGKVVPVLN